MISVKLVITLSPQNVGVHLLTNMSNVFAIIHVDSAHKRKIRKQT